MTRIEELRNAIAQRGRLLVLFSGGLDSALLARLAHDALGADAEALTIDSAVTPRAEAATARELAGAIGIRHRVVAVDELEHAHFKTNPPDRCYHCRKLRDALAKGWAAEHGFGTIADGLNHSDLSDYRPGLKAATEDGIWHPFIEHHVGKDEIREMSRELGLQGWDRPSMACLASRFPHGFAVTAQRAERVDRAEEYLRSLAFDRARVRHFPHDLAVVEVGDTARAVALREQIVSRLRELGFAFVSLDLEDYASGKMNRTAGGAHVQ